VNERNGSMDEATARFVEAMGLFFEDAGVTRIGGRLLGLLLLADRPLSLDEIARTLGVSRASVSTNGRFLLAADMIERASLPGDRRNYYRFSARGWEASLQTGITRMQRLRRLAAETLATLDRANTTGRARLQETVDFGDFIAEGMADLTERWRRTRGNASWDGVALAPRSAPVPASGATYDCTD
jgi:DNA-binding transcriptional regulator GbsR (MarR family)